MRNRALALILAALLLAGQAELYAADFAGINVLAYVESFDRRLAKGHVRAYTFGDAIAALAAENSMDIVFGHNGGKTYVYSVNAIAENRFGENDGWFGYIRRKGSVIKPQEYLSYQLEQGDEVVLYYGSKDKTRIISNLDLKAKDNDITIEAFAQKVSWFWKNGRWSVINETEPLTDVKIRIRQPDGNTRIIKTNDAGEAHTMFGDAGMYEYFAEGYVIGAFPSVVRSRDQTYLHGVADKRRVTRAEAAGFIVGAFDVSPGELAVSFTDVDDSQAGWEAIMCGASAGIFHGFDDGSFRPDEPVTLAQLAVMLSGVAEAKNEPQEAGGAPEWAAARASAAFASGLLEGVRGDWNEPVSAKTLERIRDNRN